MSQILREHANIIINDAIKAVMPDEAVKRALTEIDFRGKVILISIGKAAWQMAKAASDCIGDKIDSGIVITKYNHVKGPISKCVCVEAGHPVPDENSFSGTQKAIDIVSNLEETDNVLLLISGGGSALFEMPLISREELQDVTNKLLSCGASIVEINTIRKRLSAVKGGKFAKICSPAKVYSIVLSDIIGDPLDMIASGPAAIDNTTSEEALNIVNKYGLCLSDKILQLLNIETPKTIDNVSTSITGSVSELCKAAAVSCQKLGYKTEILTDQLSCQAKEAGIFLSSIAKTYAKCDEKIAFIAGGETIVQITGNGKGGRNQELALAAAEGIAGLDNVAVFSVGSDGTDGPTDAAGGYVDGTTKDTLQAAGLDIYSVIQQNDSYNALKLSDGLIITGPTGTNVNDVSILLIN